MIPVISVDGLSKRYQLGALGTATLRDDLTRWWARLRGESDPLLKIDDHVGKGARYGHVWALRDVSFEVKQGEVLGIIGGNGAGKSTLLKILSRVTAPTAGLAKIRGRVASLLEVGTGFHPDLTGRENIYLNGAILGMGRREIDRKLGEIVDFSGVEQYIDTPVKRYSSGMYVRLAFSVAAHLDPEILIVDEVLAVGDMEFQKRCVGRMEGVAKGGRTVLVVSHNMPLIVTLCTRALLLAKGGIVANGPPRIVASEYLATNRSHSGEVSWPNPDLAPGNEVIRLRSVRTFHNIEAGATAEVDIARDLHVELVYWCLREGELTYPALWLKTGLGIFVLSTFNAPSVSVEEDPLYGKPTRVGMYRSVCTIPANFLNDGRYVITAILGRLPSTTIVLEEDVLSFQVHDTGAMRKEYLGQWVGPVVRPRLAWRTDYLGGAHLERDDAALTGGD